MPPGNYILGACGPQYPSPTRYFHVISASALQTPLADLLARAEEADLYLLQGLHADHAERVRTVLRNFQPVTVFPEDDTNGSWGDGHGLSVVCRSAMWRVESTVWHPLRDMFTEEEMKSWKDCGACRAASEALCAALVVTLRRRDTGRVVVCATGRLSAWHVGDGGAAKVAQAAALMRCVHAAIEAAGADAAVVGGDWNSASDEAVGRLLTGGCIDPAEPEHPLQAGWETMRSEIRSPMRWRLYPIDAPVAKGLLSPLLLSDSLTAVPIKVPLSAAGARCATHEDAALEREHLARQQPQAAD